VLVDIDTTIALAFLDRGAAAVVLSVPAATASAIAAVPASSEVLVVTGTISLVGAVSARVILARVAAAWLRRVSLFL